jgi:hypothetical protein
MGAPRPLPEDDQAEEDDGSDTNYFDMISKLSRPGPRMTAYQQMLDKTPNEADYQPTKKGRLLAALAGFATGMHNPAAGFGLAKGIVSDPYEKALRQHQMEMQQGGTAANLERMSAQDQLREISAARAMGLKYNEFKLKQKQAEDLARYRTGELDTKGQELGIRRQDAATRERGVAATEARNKLTGDLNKGTLELRGKELDVKRAAQSSLDSYHKTMGEAYKKRTEAMGDKNKVQNSTQQAAAIQNAYQTLKMDPKWAEFIKSDDENPGKLKPRDPDGSSLYEMFRNELKRRVTGSLKSGVPVFDEDPDDDSGDDSRFEFMGGQ